MQIFEQIGNLKIDPKKKTVAFFDKGDLNEYTHIYGTARVIKKIIENDYNIITFGMGCGLKENYFEFKRQYSDDLLRKAQDEKYLQKNLSKITQAFKTDFKNVPNIDFFILGTDDPFRIPLTSYCSKKYDEDLCNMQNEFFDYVGDYQEKIDKIEDLNKTIINDWFRKISPIAFSTKDNSIPPMAIKYLFDTNRIGKVIAFAIDPAIYEPFYRLNNIPIDLYYFAYDNRGTRKYKEFPIAQFQHLIYDKWFKKDFFNIKKTKNVFFAGSLFQEKGNRLKIWEEFLKDFKDKDSAYYIPLRKNGGILKKGKESSRQIELVQERFNKLYSEVINHPCYVPASGPGDKTSIVKDYAYGMIFRCVSEYDSLNFRPVLYTAMGILPLLDPLYDPEYLQIPEEIQRHLVVRNADDIKQKVELLNRDESIRAGLINQLREHFEIDKFNDKNIANEWVRRILK